jgi:hypothetical protein
MARQTYTAWLALRSRTADQFSQAIERVFEALAVLASGLNPDGTAYTLPVDVSSSAPPTGASTAANQTTGNTSLASIDTKTVGSSVTLYDGAQATSTTGAPLNGGTSQSVSEVLVTNTDGSIVMYVGNATSQSTPLAAGASIAIPVNNLNKVYVKSASGTPSVAWLGRS